MVNQLRYVKLLPLQGARFATIKNPGRCPGLRAFSPYLNHLRNLSMEVKEFQMWKWISLSHLRVSKQGQALRTPGRSQ